MGFKTVDLTFEPLDFDSFAVRKLRSKNTFVLKFTIGIGDFEFISTEVTVREKENEESELLIRNS